MSKKFKSRLLFGSIGIPLLVIFFLAPTWAILGLILILAYLTYNEALELVHDKLLKFPYFLGFISIVSFVIPPTYDLVHKIFNPTLAIICFLFIIAYDIIKNLGFAKTAQHFFIIIYLSLGFYSITKIFESNRLLGVFLILLIWTFDTFQYFVGKTIGKTKIFKVSPNKSLEGLIGGAVFTIIFYFIWYFLLKFLEQRFGILSSNSPLYKDFFQIRDVYLMFMYFLKIIPALLLFGVFGDLLISQMKRSFEVKDSSSVLGEHGGFLDRLDSVISVSIAMFVVLFSL